MASFKVPFPCCLCSACLFFLPYFFPADKHANALPNNQELSVSRPFPQSTSRQHSHSISLGAVNSNNRVTRRKSVTTTAASANTAAAVAASMNDAPDSAGIAMPTHRRGSRKGLESSSVGAPPGYGSYLSRSVNSPSRDSLMARKAPPSQPQDGSSMAQTAVDGNAGPDKTVSTKNRNRRASEGGHLVKGEGKGSRPELRCDRCGKGYKHGSCLSKHMCVTSPPLPSCRPARFGALHHVGSAMVAFVVNQLL